MSVAFLVSETFNCSDCFKVPIAARPRSKLVSEIHHDKPPKFMVFNPKTLNTKQFTIFRRFNTVTAVGPTAGTAKLATSLVTFIPCYSGRIQRFSIIPTCQPVQPLRIAFIEMACTVGDVLTCVSQFTTRQGKQPGSSGCQLATGE